MKETSQRVQSLLQQIERGYAALMGFVDDLEPEAIVVKEASEAWSVKDTLAHITTWEETLLRFHLGGERLEAVVGMEAVRYRVTPFDEINRHIYRKFKDRSMDQIRERAQQVHSALTARLSRLSDEELEAPPRTLLEMGYEAGPFIEYIAGNTYEHYAEHLATLEKRLRERPPSVSGS